jgi:alkylhydroperoxidase family enzyme
VKAVYEDRRTAPVSEKTRAALGLVEALTKQTDAVEHVTELRRLGVSDDAIEDVIVITSLFNAIDRLADAFAFDVPTHDEFASAAKVQLRMGYTFPAPIWRLAHRD